MNKITTPINLELLDCFISQAMRDRNTIKLETYKLIKSEYVKKLKETGATELSTSDSFKIIQKMVSQHNDSIEQFTKANRTDLVEKETNELNILLEFLPAEPSKDELISTINEIITNIKESQGSVSMKDMKSIINKMNEKYPGIQVGKLISECIKNFM